MQVARVPLSRRCGALPGFCTATGLFVFPADCIATSGARGCQVLAHAPQHSLGCHLAGPLRRRCAFGSSNRGDCFEKLSCGVALRFHDARVGQQRRQALRQRGGRGGVEDELRQRPGAHRRAAQRHPLRIDGAR